MGTASGAGIASHSRAYIKFTPFFSVVSVAQYKQFKYVKQIRSHLGLLISPKT
jgi:hypothetical protein